MKRGPGSLYRRGETIRFALSRDRDAIKAFLLDGEIDLRTRIGLLARVLHATNHLRGYHSNAEMIRVGRAILQRPGAVVVEAGCGYGGSTAKLSSFVGAAGGVLHVFDSFRGMPANAETDHHMDGRPVRFFPGAFRGRLSAVRRAVEHFGNIQVCRFHKGWFSETLSTFQQPVDVVLLDVDLVSSTRTCIRYLYPLMKRTGVMFSQDGHLRGVAELLKSRVFWSNEVGCGPPTIDGLGIHKLISWRRQNEE
ncbi:MAG: TylF/MycF/NovP-related O-methyltransferase [Myxococcota bacterium]